MLILEALFILEDTTLRSYQAALFQDGKRISTYIVSSCNAFIARDGSMLVTSNNTNANIMNIKIFQPPPHNAFHSPTRHKVYAAYDKKASHLYLIVKAQSWHCLYSLETGATKELSGLQFGLQQYIELCHSNGLQVMEFDDIGSLIKYASENSLLGIKI